MNVGGLLKLAFCLGDVRTICRDMGRRTSLCVHSLTETPVTFVLKFGHTH